MESCKKQEDVLQYFLVIFTAKEGKRAGYRWPPKRIRIRQKCNWWGLEAAHPTAYPVKERASHGVDGSVYPLPLRRNGWQHGW